MVFDQKHVTIDILQKGFNMAQQNYIQLFADANANFISTVLLEPIVNHYRDHPDDEISKEKLLEILKLPAPATPPVTTTARTPQRGTGTAATQPLTTAPKRTRSTRTTADRPRCKWVFTKGTNQGKQCPGYAAEDSEYCSACKNKKGAGGSGRKAANATGGTTTTKAPAKGGAKTGFTAAAKAEAKEAPQETEYEVSVDDFGESTDGYALLLDSGSGFVLKQVDDDTFTVVGFCDDAENKVMRALTKAEKEQAKKLLQLEIEDGVELA